jgi:hypothetical protein
MAVPKSKKPSVAQVLKLVDQLSPKEQEELRQAFLEDGEDIRICLERLKHPKTISHQELKKKLGMAD